MGLNVDLVSLVSSFAHKKFIKKQSNYQIALDQPEDFQNESSDMSWVNIYWKWEIQETISRFLTYDLPVCPHNCFDVLVFL